MCAMYAVALVLWLVLETSCALCLVRYGQLADLSVVCLQIAGCVHGMPW